MREKHRLCFEIASCAGVPPPPISTGSTEPKKLFELVSDALGLDLDPRLTKPRLAGGICKAAGLEWDSACWSSGGTVTVVGLRRVLDAVTMLTGMTAKVRTLQL